MTRQLRQKLALYREGEPKGLKRLGAEGFGVGGTVKFPTPGEREVAWQTCRSSSCHRDKISRPSAAWCARTWDSEI